MIRRGTVSSIDDDAGLGRVVSGDGREYTFHIVEIADGTRSIDVGQAVTFELLRRFGRSEAGSIHKT